MDEILVQIAPEIDREIPPEIPREIFKPNLTKYPKRILSPFSRVMEFLHKYFISICSLNLILN